MVPTMNKDVYLILRTIKQKQNERFSLTPNPQAPFTPKLSCRVFSCASKYIEGGRTIVISESCLVLVLMHRKEEGKWTQD